MMNGHHQQHHYNHYHSLYHTAYMTYPTALRTITDHHHLHPGPSHTTVCFFSVSFFWSTNYHFLDSMAHKLSPDRPPPSPPLASNGRDVPPMTTTNTRDIDNERTPTRRRRQTRARDDDKRRFEMHPRYVVQLFLILLMIN
jgi:hypothetical protein